MMMAARWSPRRHPSPITTGGGPPGARDSALDTHDAAECHPGQARGCGPAEQIELRGPRGPGSDGETVSDDDKVMTRLSGHQHVMGRRDRD